MRSRVRPPKLHGWRKLAGASWGAPADPQFYGELEIDAAPMLAFIASAREQTGAHVTLTHLVGKALAYGLTAVPELNVRLTRGRAYPRVGVDVFFIVATAEGTDLSGVKVQDVQAKSAVQVAAELTARVRAVTHGDDPELGKSKTMMARLPQWLLRRGLRLAAWVTSDLDVDLPALGMRRQTFGSAMVTSVGMWGVVRAYAPLASYYRVPVLVLVGAVTERPVVVEGEVVARPVLTVTATFDHRYADGSQAARLAEAVHLYCASPEAFDSALSA